MRGRGRLAVTALLLAGACNRQPAQVVCTALFAYVTITVTDSLGNPVTGLAISDTIRRTGEGFVVPQMLPVAAGSYVILDDNSLGRLRTSGDSLRVTGSSGSGRGFAADFVFDAPEGCHIRKVAGPVTVIARP